MLLVLTGVTAISVALLAYVNELTKGPIAEANAKTLNEALKDFSGALLFTSQDHQFVQTTANRIMEITENGLIDKECTYDEYLENNADARKRQIVEISEED